MRFETAMTDTPDTLVFNALSEHNFMKIKVIFVTAIAATISPIRARARVTWRHKITYKSFACIYRGVRYGSYVNAFIYAVFTFLTGVSGVSVMAVNNLK